MRRIPIRMKLATALAVPLVVLVTVTAVELSNASGDAAAARRERSLGVVTLEATGVMAALQDERTWAFVDLVGAQDDVTVPVVGYEDTRGNVDEGLTRFRRVLDDAGDAARQAYDPVLRRIDDELEQLRADVDGNEAARDLDNIGFADDVYDRYAALTGAILRANGRVAIVIDDHELRQGVELLDTTSQQIEDLSDLVRTSLAVTVSAGSADQRDGVVRLAMVQGSFNRGADALRAADGPYEAVVADRFPAALVEDLNGHIDQAVTQGSADIGALLGLFGVGGDVSYAELQQGIAEVIADEAEALEGAAGSRDRWLVALVTLTVLATAGLAWLVSRSITQPLRALTRQAKEMAEDRLPNAVADILETPLGENVQVPQTEPVAVATGDEVADVADALNTVQVTALDLAVEQAVLRRNIADSFVNLGRRNQNLLGRQLDFITELESNETDPDTLASLFRLDHLATRMRRNAESLLVLAGIEPPRKWAAPVRITDIIRAALGEVEDYQRVTVRGVEPATILGSAAADIAHLIAEFVENALTFSPPEEQVEIRGQGNPDGQGYTLAIIDLGFGMLDADLVEANRRLNGAESFTIAPSKYLGHYVAGNLAARHGIGLRLESSPGSGVTATVALPPSLLTTEEPTDEPITDPHGTRRVTPDVPPAPEPEPKPEPAPPALAEVGTPGAGGGPAAPTVSSASPAPTGSAMPSGRAASSAPTERAGRLRGPAPRPADAGVRAERTPSGLVKRTPRNAPAGPAAPDRRAHDEALASLANLNLRAARGPVSSPRPAPPPSRPPSSEPTAPASPPPTSSAPGLAARRGPQPDITPPAPGFAATPPVPPRAAAPMPPPLSAAETTQGGLARRVPGRHMPETGLVSMPRDGHEEPGVEPEAAAPEPHDPGDVYGFLTSFTSGVQRGLDASRTRDGGDGPFPAASR